MTGGWNPRTDSHPDWPTIQSDRYVYWYRGESVCWKLDVLFRGFVEGEDYE